MINVNNSAKHGYKIEITNAPFTCLCCQGEINKQTTDANEYFITELYLECVSHWNTS